MVIPNLETMVEFLRRSGSDDQRSPEVLRSAVGLLGDLGQTFGPRMQFIFMQPFVQEFINEAAQDEDNFDTVQWAKSVVVSVMQAKHN